MNRTVQRTPAGRTAAVGNRLGRLMTISKVVMGILARDQALVDYIAGRLVELGESIPEEIPSFALGKKGVPWKDERLFDFTKYPPDLYVAPGTVVANRAALAKWGAWVNAFGAQEYGRPLIIAASADLADSTNISGFGKPYGDFPGYGWYERYGSADGVMLPQEITEFTNAGILAGMATVNLAQKPGKDFDGFWGACSTYRSFSYLKYGKLRLFSLLAQDCQLKVGKVIYIAGHSGPETADDSRTHFGIFEPAVMQLFPRGQILNLHPWEHNEVPVLLGEALGTEIPIVVLHLTRPPIAVPDRNQLGMPSHFAAAHGAYVVQNYLPGKPKGGTFVVQGTSAMVSLVNILPEIKRRGLNIKIIYGASPELFARQSEGYREQVISKGDVANSNVISTQSRASMRDWMFNKEAENYALTSDRDNCWRTGGTLEEVIDEAHRTPQWILMGIERFVAERAQRLERIEADLKAAFSV